MLLAPIMEIVGKLVRLTDDHLPGVKNRRGCVQEPVYPLHKTSASLSEEETVNTKKNLSAVTKGSSSLYPHKPQV